MEYGRQRKKVNWKGIGAKENIRLDRVNLQKALWRRISVQSRIVGKQRRLHEVLV